MRTLPLLLMFAALQSGVATAYAQAALVQTMPADDTVLQHAPAGLTLRFDRAVTPQAFKLLLPDGSVRQVQAQRAAGEGGPESLKVALPLSTLQGTYLLSWNVAGDGKSSGGAVTYSLGYRSDICVVNPGTGSGGVSLGPPPAR